MSNEEPERFMEWVKSGVWRPKREWVGLSEKSAAGLKNLLKASKLLKRQPAAQLLVWRQRLGD